MRGLLAASAIGGLAASPAIATAATPQAVAINAGFLEQIQPPDRQVAVCVLDSGVNITHDTPASVVIARDSSVRQTPSPELDPGDTTFEQPLGHGTPVAAAIAAPADSVGGSGIWPHARIVSVRGYHSVSGGFRWLDYTDGLERCRLATTDVVAINASFGGLGPSAEKENFEARMQSVIIGYGISVIAGAGNDAGVTEGYPASFPGVIAVSATNSAGSRCSFANVPAGELAAMGCGGLQLTSADGNLRNEAGTSFAAPQATAVLAALRAYRRADGTFASREEAEAALRSTARPAITGLRLLDAGAAFRAAGLGHLVPAEPTPGPAPSPAPERSVAPPLTPAPTTDSPAPTRTTSPLARPTRPKLKKRTLKRKLVVVKLTRVARGSKVIVKPSRGVVRANRNIVVLRRLGRKRKVLIRARAQRRVDGKIQRRLGPPLRVVVPARPRPTRRGAAQTAPRVDSPDPVFGGSVDVSLK